MKQENNIKNRKTYIIAYIYIIMSYVYNHIFVYIYISKKIELFLDFHASHVSRQSMPAIDVAEKNAPSQSLKLCPAQLVEIPSGHQLWPDEKKLHPLRPRYGKKYTKKTYKLHIMVWFDVNLQETYLFFACIYIYIISVYLTKSFGGFLGPSLTPPHDFQGWCPSGLHVGQNGLFHRAQGTSCVVNSKESQQWPFSSRLIPSLKLTVRTWKWMVGVLVSFWDGLFSGAMLVSGSVVCISQKDQRQIVAGNTYIGKWYWPSWHMGRQIWLDHVWRSW